MKEAVEIAIRERLREKGLTVTAFARLLGVSRITVYNLMNGVGSTDLFKKAAKFLEIPLYALLADASHKGSGDEDLLSKYHIAEPRVRSAVDLLLGVDEPKYIVPDRPSVLVVDDVKDNVELYARSLRKDFEVRPFTDPIEALESARREPVDVIITDQRMPGMTGTRLIVELNEIRSEIPKIVISAYSDNQAFLEAINEAKVDAFVVKPILPSNLREQVTNLLTRRGWQKERQRPIATGN